MTRAEFERVRAAALLRDGPPDNWHEILLGLTDLVVNLHHDVAEAELGEGYWREQASDLTDALEEARKEIRRLEERSKQRVP